MSLQGGLGIERMCLLAGICRAGFYRHLRAQDPWEEEMGVRSEAQRIALEHQGRYGYRRITAELRRQGMAVNHKRVARLMREDNLVGTELQLSLDNLTGQCDHGEIYVNLANRLKLTGPNQVWVADITFVRLKREFFYLAVVLDKFSRKVVGWNLDRTLTARLPLAALDMALESRSPVTGKHGRRERHGYNYGHRDQGAFARREHSVNCAGECEGLAAAADPISDQRSECASDTLNVAPDFARGMFCNKIGAIRYEMSASCGDKLFTWDFGTR
jgi:putative transposase